MGGSIAQEMGHDLVIMYFIDKVLKPRKRRELFFIVHPAMGPNRDIHFWNSAHNEYTSAWDVSKEKFIPEYNARIKLPMGIFNSLVKRSQYWKEPWYEKLSQELGKDLKQFTDKLCDSMDSALKTVDKLPDFIGINQKGKVTSLGEVKFEYLPKKAEKELLGYYNVAKRLQCPFYLIFPKKGFYIRTDYNWIKKILPEDVKAYTFSGEEQEKRLLQPIVVPNYHTIQFNKWGR